MGLGFGLWVRVRVRFTVRVTSARIAGSPLKLTWLGLELGLG